MKKIPGRKLYFWNKTKCPDNVTESTCISECDRSIDRTTSVKDGCIRNEECRLSIITHDVRARMFAECLRVYYVKSLLLNSGADSPEFRDFWCQKRYKVFNLLYNFDPRNQKMLIKDYAWNLDRILQRFLHGMRHRVLYMNWMILYRILLRSNEVSLTILALSCGI